MRDEDRGDALLRVASDWYHNQGDEFLAILLGEGAVWLRKLGTIVIQTLLGQYAEKNFGGTSMDPDAPYIEAMCHYASRLAGEKILLKRDGTYSEMWSAKTTDDRIAYAGTAEPIEALSGVVMMIREEIEKKHAEIEEVNSGVFEAAANISADD